MIQIFELFGNFDGELKVKLIDEKLNRFKSDDPITIQVKGTEQFIDALKFILRNYDDNIVLELKKTNQELYRYILDIHNKYFSQQGRKKIETLLSLAKPHTYLSSEDKYTMWFDDFYEINVPKSYISHIAKISFPFTLNIGFKFEKHKKLSSGAIVTYPAKLYHFSSSDLQQLENDMADSSF